MSADGRFGWYAYNPDGSPIADDDEPLTAPPEGSTIRLMGEHTVDVPLWEEGGLMFSSPDELVQVFDLSPGLVEDLVAWGIAWESRSGQPDHDAEAAALVRRLDRETHYRYHLVYKP